MATPLPPPTPPEPGSSWKASDILYVAGSALGLFSGAAFYISTFPRLTAAIGVFVPFFFWAASYASNKGD